MDPNTKQSVVIDAVGPLANFGQLNPSTSGNGPIERIPNEIMQLIMAKLELEGDVTNLVRLRSVSTRRKALVEDYFEQKKSLIVIDSQLQSNSYDYVKEIFFGFAKLNDFTRLVLVSKIPLDCLRSLLGMFPNIVQLSISNCYDRIRVPDLVDYINSLDFLKQLDLDVSFVPAANLSPTWPKLEHFSVDVRFLDEDERLQLVSHFKPNCTRVYFNGKFTYGQVRQWHTNNPNWLANLTHLRIWVDGTSEEYAQFVHNLSEHATSMKILNLTFMSWTDPLNHVDIILCTSLFLSSGARGLVHSQTHTLASLERVFIRSLLQLFPIKARFLEMTPTLIRDLSKLTNLAELKLENITMDIRELTKTIAQDELTSVVSVLTCKLDFLCLVGDGPISGGQLTRVLSVIFPNLGQFDLTLVIIDQHLTQQFEHEFEQYLYRFPKLRNHNINYL